MITTRKLAGLIIDLIDAHAADMDAVSKQNALGQASTELLDRQKEEARAVVAAAKLAAEAEKVVPAIAASPDTPPEA